MRFLDIFKKFFSKNESDVITDIIAICSLMPMPKREDYAGDVVFINAIDNYKKEYNKIICQTKHLTSIDFNADKLIQDMKIDTELLLKIFLASDEIKQITLEDKIDFEIKVKKLELYFIALLAKEREVIERIIALNEIYQNKIFLTKNKRDAIANTINNLMVTYVTFNTQKNAILIERENYLKQMEMYNINDEDRELEKQKLLEKRKELLEIEEIIFGREVYGIREDNLIEDIATVERIIEIYVYKTKDNLKLYEEELENLTKKELNYKSKDEILKEVNELEKKYLVYKEYGYNLIKLEDMMNLYRFKFQVYTTKKEGCFCEVFVNEKMSEWELEGYKKVVLEKIELFLNKQQPDIITPDEANISDVDLVITNIVKILRNGRSFTDPEEILKIKHLLNLLMALEQEKGLKNLLANYIVKKQDVKAEYLQDWVFTWEEEIPLGSIYWMAENINLIGNLYSLLQKYWTDDNYYVIPEGIREIDCYKKGTIAMDKIREGMTNKILVFPKSLKRLSGQLIFFRQEPKWVELNEGLEEIGPEVFTDFMSIELPTTMRKIHHNALWWDRFNPYGVTFRDASITPLFLDDDELINLIVADYEHLYYRRQEISKFLDSLSNPYSAASQFPAVYAWAKIPCFNFKTDGLDIKIDQWSLGYERRMTKEEVKNLERDLYEKKYYPSSEMKVYDSQQIVKLLKKKYYEQLARKKPGYERYKAQSQIEELLKMPVFKQLLKMLSLKEAMIIALKCININGKYFSTEQVAELLEIEPSEVIEITKKALSLYKDNLNDILDNKNVEQNKLTRKLEK